MEYELSEHLKKVMVKLQKKDPETYSALIDKIKEIVSSENLEHYKPLRYGLKGLKRVHIRKSFVLIFEHDRQRGKITFLDYDHHDKIYD